MLAKRVKACINPLKVLLGSRTKKKVSVKPMSVSKSKFGALADGTKVSKYTLTNANGVKVGILDYGGTVKEIFVPDRNGKMANVSLGFATIEEYVEKVPILDVLPGDMLTELLLENLYWKEKNTLLPLITDRIIYTEGTKDLINLFGKQELLRLGLGWSLLELVRMGKRGIRGL